MGVATLIAKSWLVESRRDKPEVPENGCKRSQISSSGIQSEDRTYCVTINMSQHDGCHVYREDVIPGRDGGIRHNKRKVLHKNSRIREKPNTDDQAYFEMKQAVECDEQIEDVMRLASYTREPSFVNIHQRLRSVLVQYASCGVITLWGVSCRTIIR